MSTTIRPEVSKANPCYISKHRYYELRHFCCQYPEWKRKLASLSYFPQVSTSPGSSAKEWQDRTGDTAYEKSVLSKHIQLVGNAAKETDKDLWPHILRGATTPGSYDTLNAKEPIPFSREKYYELFRRFFYILDKWRD